MTFQWLSNFHLSLAVELQRSNVTYPSVPFDNYRVRALSIWGPPPSLFRFLFSDSGQLHFSWICLSVARKREIAVFRTFRIFVLVFKVTYLPIASSFHQAEQFLLTTKDLFLKKNFLEDILQTLRRLSRRWKERYILCTSTTTLLFFPHSTNCIFTHMMYRYNYCV